MNGPILNRWLGALVLLAALGSYAPSTSAYNVCEDGGDCTHEAMTRQALEIFFEGDPDFPADLREEILYGSEDPDQTEALYGCEGIFGAVKTCSHLWDSDESLGLPFVLSPFGEDKLYPNALQASQALWTRALGAYAEGDIEKAYRYLGMVAHFLGDQTIPAHAHNDTHPAILGDGDYFEVTMSQGKLPTDCIFRHPVDLERRAECQEKLDDEFIGGIHAELNDAEIEQVREDGILYAPDTITEIDRQFLWLFITTNQIADAFPSDDYAGDRNTPDDDRSPFVQGWVLDALNDFQEQEVTDNEFTTYDNCGTQIREDGDGIDECPGLFQTLRTTSYFRGIRALAGLFALWQEAIKQPILKVSVVSMKELEEGDDDTGLVDGTNDDDMYVGMVMGINRKVYEQDCTDTGSPSYCEYQVATFLEDEDADRRKVDGAFLASNTTRRDADPYPFDDGYADCLQYMRDDMCFDAEGMDEIRPLYRWGQVYSAGPDGQFDAGDDVEFRIYGWDADAESDFESLFNADDLLDVDPASGSSVIKFRVDLEKCFLADGRGDDAVVIDGTGTISCGETQLMKGAGGQNNDTQLAFNVQFENILDDDGDGVPNIMDDCPDTPPDTPVSPRGCPNRAPVASDDSFVLAEDGELSGNFISDDNGNGPDSDEDGDVILATSWTLPAHGTHSVSVYGDFTYTPNADYCGPDSFTYQLTDVAQTPPQMMSNTATVSIDVTCVNDSPEVTGVTGADQEVEYGREIEPIIITVEDVDDTSSTLSLDNLPDELASGLTLSLVECSVVVTESPDEDGSICTWMISGRAFWSGGPTGPIVIRAGDDDGTGTAVGQFSLLVFPPTIPTLSTWAMVLLALLMLGVARGRGARV